MRGSVRFVVLCVVAASLAAPSAARAANATGRNVQLPVGLSVAGVIEDTHGSPVAGASVALCPTAETCSEGGEALTGNDGGFAVTVPSPGTYFLWAMPPEGSNLLLAWDDGTPSGSASSLDAVEIEIVANVAGREIHLPDGLRITGTTKDPEGDPLAGVTVGASGPSVGGGGVSGADGHYEIVGLAPGTYTLRVYAPDASDYPNGIVVDGGVAADDGETEATPYELVGSDLTGQNITLVKGRSISGHVDGAGGRPVEVMAFDAPVSYRFPVDGSGNYTLKGLYPGTYHLLFTVPETLGDHFPYGVYDGPGQVLADQSAPGEGIDVSGGNVTGLRSILPVLPSLSGTLRDVSGPVPGAMLNACDPDRGCARAVAASDGSWSIRNVPPGAYTIQAGAAHHVVVGYAAGRSSPDPDATAPVTVGSTSVGGIDVVLPRGSAISGVVTGPGGVPLAGIHVAAVPSTGGIWEFGPGGVETGSNGAFTVTGLANGSYRLAFSPPDGSPYLGGYWSTGGLRDDWSLATPIAVSDGVAPSVSAPKAAIRLGGQLGSSSVPVRLTWSASDPGSNVEAHRLQQQTNNGTWTTVATPATPAANRALKASSTTTYQFRSRGTDYSGNTSTNEAGPTFRVLRKQQTSTAVTWKGTWATRSSSSASGGSYRRTSTAGASASFSFTGRSVGWVAAAGPTQGSAKVYIDGTYAGSVDLHAPTTSWRRVVFAKTWSSSGSHRIRVVCQATPGHPRITIDAFVVLR
jgi:hypothetical protein